MILIVDNEARAREVLARILSNEGHKVMEASDGEQALALLKDPGGFELVISDLVMPKLDGFKLVDQIRIHWPKTKILLISAYLQEDAARLILGEKVEFLRKPINSKEMIARANRLVHKAH